jgi:hypothetical protein
MPRLSFALRSLGLFVGLCLCAVPTAEAATIPFVRICVDLVDTPDVPEVCAEFEFELGDRKVISFERSLTLGGLANILVFGEYNTDPFVSFGVTTTTIVPGPVVFSFLFGTPIVPDFYNTATSTGSLTLTPAVTDALVENSVVYPTYISGYGTLGAVPTNLGVDLGTADCSAPALTGAETCPQGSTTNTFPLTFYDNLEALLTYSQTGLLSVADWDGMVELTNDPAGPGGRVPEPASMLLVATGAVAALIKRRSRPSGKR